MLNHAALRLRLLLIIIVMITGALVHNICAPALADEPAVTQPIEKGLRVYSAGHSFHVFVPGQLIDMAKGAGIKEHVFVGLSPIGGSRVIQHWDVADDKF